MLFYLIFEENLAFNWLFSFFEDMAFLRLLMAKFSPLNFFGPGKPERNGWQWFCCQDFLIFLWRLRFQILLFRRDFLPRKCMLRKVRFFTGLKMKIWKFDLLLSSILSMSENFTCVWVEKSLKNFIQSMTVHQGRSKLKFGYGRDKNFRPF